MNCTYCLNPGNKNSSIPSSQTDKDDSSLGQNGTKGKGKKFSSDTVDNHNLKKTVTIIPVDTCNSCGESLHDLDCVEHERRTKIDIVFEKVVEHFDAEVKQCPNCNTVEKGKFPIDVHGPLQYGNGLKAFVINLLVCQMVSLNRIQSLVNSMMGVVISEASLLKFTLRLYYALEQWEEQSIKQLLVSTKLTP